jgi:hypothetical protein
VKFAGAALVALAAVAVGEASAAEDPAACRDCGVVQDIRRLALPTRPRVDPLAPGPGLPQSGAPTSTTPLFSIGTGGIQRVDPYESPPGQKVVWEVTVRYDNGAFGVTRVEHEPDLKVGERVRLIESGTENQLQRLPPPKP